ncbi:MULTISPECIES: flagellin [unclassified Roseateles]|uniref:flagellin N-terminal helical domain-containing protein n=1 Tax=unclassified Roseateles TaxID=2626991 RepID=UPI0006FDE170|nr:MULTISPECIES: flagellin [unclassified Roseateles]KQW51871.1 flagellin [Pelomonas sp. Root405]KRA78104.1 flagellin [Pelomonas sp. Root662]
MPQTINTNINSLNAQRNLNSSQQSLAVSMQRLSSGLRVNSAKDDAAGLAIAERMNTQVRGMNVAIRNANDGISLAQTAEGALGKIGDNLQRMRELTVQARNSTNSNSDKDSLNKEFEQLGSEIWRIVNATTFNSKPILADTAGVAAGTGQTFQIGANTTSNDSITVAALDLTQDPTVVALLGAGAAPFPALIDNTADFTALGVVMDNIDLALDTINNTRATYGAIQSRFDAVISNLQVAVENQTSARSRIMDADFAQETANMSRAQILQQAGNAMVAQANQLPQQVLSLLQR